MIEFTECYWCGLEMPISEINESTDDGKDFCKLCSDDGRDPRNADIHVVLDILNRTFEKALPLKKELDELNEKFAKFRLKLTQLTTALM